jgi:hypothetical protein
MKAHQIIGMVMVMISSLASQALPVSLKTILQRPLIAGASVSADAQSASPGKKLALRFTSASMIRTAAAGGRTGAESIKTLHESDLQDRSIILALDFFFWDSALPSADQSIAALDKLVEMSTQSKIPLVIGNIPELIPGNQPSRGRLNEAIAQKCTQQKNCFVMSLSELHEQVRRDGYLKIQGKNVKLSEIIPDGLHLSHQGSDELANRLETLLSAQIKKGT